MTRSPNSLIGMGYPEQDRRDDGELDSVTRTARIGLGGAYGHDRVVLRTRGAAADDGRAQPGGIQAVKVLPSSPANIGPGCGIRTPTPLRIATIVDPLTGAMRPVVGLSVSYASAVGAGGVAFLLPNQWSMMHRLRTIPDTVDDFTGFTIRVDLVALSFSGARGASEYRHNGTAEVRNVVLPFQYSHVVVPVTRELATSESMREWINAYVPGRKDPLESLPPGPSENVLWAADVWYSIKKHWCLEAQQLIRARRAALAAQ
jgi:hypothetical protein